jgi:AcrR family transcriptional regulator
MSKRIWHNAGVPQSANRGPGRPPAAKAAETRERIVHAARQVFSEVGYDAATFQAIAMRADLTRPAINHYFASKRLLYREVVETTDALVKAGLERAQGQTTLLGRMSAFIIAATQADAEDRSAAAFLVTSVLESQRHPELRYSEHDSLTNTRAFLTWVVTDAINNGELTIDTEISPLIEMLVAVFCGFGFYAGFVGSHDELEVITEQLRRLLAGRLWQLHE